MEKKKLVVLFLSLFVFVLLLLGYIFREREEVPNETSSTTEVEEVAEEEPVVHDLKLSLVSPEGESFFKGQARMYDGFVEGNGKYSNQVRCHWDFYMNENNDEVLYRSMDNKGILSGESKNICGFTSTFIEKIGVLRVVLTMTVYDASGDLESISAEREYIVK